MNSVNKRLINILIIIVGSLLHISAYSQQFNFKTREESNIAWASDLDNSGGTPFTLFTVEETEFWYYSTLGNWGNWRASNKFKSAHAFIKAEINHEYPLMVDSAYIYKINYRFRGYNQYSGSQGQMYDDTLIISYNPDSLTIYQDKFVKKYSNIFRMENIEIINIYDITDTSTPPRLVNLSTPGNINLNFSIQATIETQVYVLGTNGSKNLYGPNVPLYTYHYAPSGTNYLETWCNVTSSNVNSVAKVTPANFQLEWTYVDDYGVDSGTRIPANDLSYNFRNNSTRVWLDSNSYRIPLVYEGGYIVYRYRMVRPDSDKYQYPIYTNWTITSDSGSLSSLDLNGTTQVFKIDDPHLGDSLNWQYTISFAEEGKYKHVLSYYDGLLKNRQTITRFNSDPSKVLVTENIYDFEGRPAIKILPTPVNDNYFSYQDSISINSVSALPYKALDFDTLNTDTCQVEVTPSPLKSYAHASKYYSTSNPDQSGVQQFVPDAEGYPFVQTVFDPVIADRVQVQGGAGASLQVGNDHYTRNEYVGADQPNLNQLFGIDIGYNGFYRKTVTTDPNGQLSMSISDHKGRPVASSLIGTGPDSLTHAIVPNDNVPGAASFSQELIQGQRQLTVGNSISLERSFYMDVSGNSNLQYVYEFQPMSVDWCPNSYLSVDADYYYYLTDKCGQVVFSEQNTLGTTGVQYSANTVTDSKTTPVYLEKGEHTVKKVLTIDVDDAYEAVDSFMSQRSSCMFTQDMFIAWEYEKLELPCPSYTVDPCAQKKRQMMDDLYPGTGKYGSYAFFDSNMYSASYGANSVFSYIEPDGQRYQDSCLNLQDTMTINGKFYQGVASMTPRSFIKIFNDSIAEQLLPLHPEYCKLLGCYVDTFKEMLLTIPDGVTAETQNLLYLQDIIATDPITQRMALPPLSMDPDTIIKRLSTTINGLYIDSLLLPIAYCNCSDPTMYRTCREKIFKNEIDNAILIDDELKNYYFEYMLQMYIQNRQRFVDAMRAGAGNTCTPCQVPRIDTIIGSPVFEYTFDTSGTKIDTNSIWYSWYSVSNDTTITSVTDALQKLLENMGSEDSLLKYEDSAQLVIDSVNYYLSVAQADSIVARLGNCAMGNATLYNAIHDSLLSLYEQGVVKNGNYTPEHIRYALETNGITMNDLCNPYLVNYDNFDSSAKLSNSGQKVCKSTDFYDDIRTFLSRYEILRVLAQNCAVAKTVIVNPSTNQFESGLLDSLNNTIDSSIQVAAEYDQTDNLYTLYMVHGADTVTIYLKGKNSGAGFACQNIFNDYIGIGEELEVTDLYCKNDLSVDNTTGYINLLAFGATVSRTDCGSTTTCSLLGWIGQTKTMASSDNMLAGAVPCTDMRSLYEEFEDTLQTYGIYGSDHPSFDPMLRSFMNYRLGRVFTDYDYNRFIESCALADSMELAQYVAYSSLKFTDSNDANTFIAALNTVNSNIYVPKPYMEIDSATDEVLMLVDFNQLPRDVLWQYKNFINNSTIPTAKLLNQPLSNWHTSDQLGYMIVPQYAWSAVDNYANTSTYDDDVFGVGNGNNFEIDLDRTVYVEFGGGWQQCRAYNIIDVASGGATASQRSEALYNASMFMYNNGYANLIWNNFKTTIDDDYFASNKKSFLQYNYSAQHLPTLRVLDTLSEDSLNANVYTVSGATYFNATYPDNTTDLYVFEGNSPLLDTLEHMLNTFVSGNNSINGDNSLFLSENSSSLIYDVGTQGYTSDVHGYRCADGSYLFVHFNDHLHMYYAFVDMPKYIPVDEHKNYTLEDIAPLADFGVSRNFKVSVKHSSTGHELDLYGRAGFGVADHETLESILLNHPITAELSKPDTFDNCEHARLQEAIRIGIYRHERYIDSIRNSLRDTFVAYLMGNTYEELHISYLDQKFQTTLYYYDLAGNLTTTVPPEGVVKLNSAILNTVNTARDVDSASKGSVQGLYPQHKKKSIYKYNSLNQLVYQKTPDGGEVDYYYDAAGRLIFSQNDKQKAVGAYTYNLYDKQSRIIETGEILSGCEYFAPTATPPDPEAVDCYTEVNGIYYSKLEIILNVRDKTHEDVTDYVHSLPRKDIIETFYDTAITTDNVPATMSEQENLRRRVSAVKYYHNKAMYDLDHDNYIHAIYYSYDVGGNVKKLVHNFPQLDEYGQRYKRVDYDYDLISGKVNMISYNRGFADQYYQRYDYDDDNRITKVETTRDGYLWQRDAEYEYYQHGPLARLSMGDLRVQGVDYIYTIQGWLKAINSDIRDPRFDAGKDGDTISVHSADAYAMSLQYFDGDYKPINGDTGILRLPERNKDLYNGNIARQTTSIMALPPLSGNYTYDQLNRINNTQYDQVFVEADSLVAINDYYNTFQYDQDGNLLYLKRRGNGTGSTIGSTSYLMDSLTYYYSGVQDNNKLLNVKDHAADNYNNDLKHDTTSTIKYVYDEVGNLTVDHVTGQDTILWNLYNKVTQTRSSAAKNSIDFYYDGMGNRIAKNVIQEADTVFTEEGDYYVRDAQGNILAVYRSEIRYKYTKIKIVRSVHDIIIGGHGGGDLVTDFIGPNYSNNGDFIISMVDAFANNTGWLTNKVASYNVSFFPINNASIQYNLINNGTEYIVPLFQHNSGSVIADAWKDMFANGSQTEVENWTNALFIDPTKNEELIQLMCTADPTEALIDQLLDDYGLGNDTNCLTDGTNIAGQITVLKDLAGYLKYAYDNYTTEFEAYLDAIAQSSSVYNYAGYTGTGGTLLTEVPDNLNTHGDMNAFHGFLDSWVDADNYLDAVTSPTQRASTIYNVDPVAAMIDYGNNANYDAIDTAVVAIPSFSVSAFGISATTTFQSSSGDIEEAFNTERTTDKNIYYLAEHHLYGSSRLGIKNYWPDQYYYSADYSSSQINPSISSEKLNAPTPWYSYKLQDVIRKDAFTPYGYPHLSNYILTNLRGQKAYELTNHLGNVQAVVKDKRIHYDLNGDDSVDVYGPSLHAVFDHYPFGMLMPGRYMQDTVSQCITVSHPGGVREVFVPINFNGLIVHPATGWNAKPVGGATITVSEVENIEYYNVTSGSIGDGMEQFFQLNPGVAHNVVLNVSSVTGDYSAQVTQLVNGSWTPLTSSSITSATQYTLGFTPTATDVRLQIVSTTSSASLIMRGTELVGEEPGSQPFSYTICTRPRDNYRFGFNGQEKDNEIKGVGNSLDFKFRGYDSRLGRFISRDPLAMDYPWNSTYAFAENDVIRAIDLEGLERYIIDLPKGLNGKAWIRINDDPNRNNDFLFKYSGEDRLFKKWNNGFERRAEKTLLKYKRNDTRSKITAGVSFSYKMISPFESNSSSKLTRDVDKELTWLSDRLNANNNLKVILKSDIGNKQASEKAFSPNETIKIDGSPGTPKQLSIERSETIKSILINNYEVNPSQIEIKEGDYRTKGDPSQTQFIFNEM